MSDAGGSTNSGAAVALTILGVAAVALWAERKTEALRAEALRAANVQEEVKLHAEALAAIKKAHEQILIARRAADRLRDFKVTFDVRARLETALTEDLDAATEDAAAETKPPQFLLMLEDRSEWPDLKERVDRLLRPASMTETTDEPVQARSALLDVINAEGGIWTASRALTHLESREWRTESARPLNVVGNLLGVMARDGEIARAGRRGEYTSLQPAASRSAQGDVAPGVVRVAPGAWIFDTAAADVTSATDSVESSQERG